MIGRRLGESVVDAFTSPADQSGNNQRLRLNSNFSSLSHTHTPTQHDEHLSTFHPISPHFRHQRHLSTCWPIFYSFHGKTFRQNQIRKNGRRRLAAAPFNDVISIWIHLKIPNFEKIKIFKVAPTLAVKICKFYCFGIKKKSTGWWRTRTTPQRPKLLFELGSNFGSFGTLGRGR